MRSRRGRSFFDYGFLAPIVIVLFFALIVAIYFSDQQDKEKAKEIEEIDKQLKIEAQIEAEKLKAEKEEREKEIATYSFYQKIEKGLDVNVLVIGDSIGAQNWQDPIKEYINTKYKVDNDMSIKFTNVSMGGNASYAGYVRTMALDNEVSYDLAIICYGQNDSLTDFSMYYETIIRAIINKCPGCNIISILESSQKGYTEKMLCIQDICDYYAIPIADTIKAFNESGYEYDELTNDGVHPNEIGLNVYSDTIAKVIDDGVVKSIKKMEDFKPIDDRVKSFDNFIYYGKDDFTRADDLSYSIKVSNSGILGIDYNYKPGDNSVSVFLDNEELTPKEVFFNYDFSQRHILVLTENGTVKNEIKVVFGSKEQADDFKGLCFSWK